MKGLVLAGGTGSRLHPLTLVTNKHLLPVYDQPMIHYPLRTLAGMGITDVMVILGGRSIGDIVELLGDGSAFGLRLTYRYQARPMGIAHAIGLARDFVGLDNVCVVLGDNILLGPDLTSFAEAFEAGDFGAGSLLYQVPDPERFGVAVFDANGRITGFLEKPLVPPSDLIPIGVYLLAPDAFDVIDKLKPSGRGELEITDVLTHYARADALLTEQYAGSWSDAGTIESLLTASTHVSEFDPTADRIRETAPEPIREAEPRRIRR